MAEGYEVCEIGEATDDGQDHIIATDFGKPLNEVHGDVTLDSARYGERLQKLGGMKVLCFVVGKQSNF
jgi:hypothetical protein